MAGADKAVVVIVEFRHPAYYHFLGRFTQRTPVGVIVIGQEGVGKGDKGGDVGTVGAGGDIQS
jgi:hypothetical protein